MRERVGNGCCRRAGRVVVGVRAEAARGNGRGDCRDDDDAVEIDDACLCCVHVRGDDDDEVSLLDV